MRITGGFGFPLGCAAVVAVAIGADVAGATAHPLYALVPLALVVLAAATSTTPAAATGVAAVAWAVESGFVLGREGHLVFDTASLRVAVVLAAALVVGVLSGLVVDHSRPRNAVGPAPQPSAPPPAERGSRYSEVSRCGEIDSRRVPGGARLGRSHVVTFGGKHE
ncbi:hypothetical protein ACWEOE_29230 [Amycolatopsis sp. NPDC004368]